MIPKRTLIALLLAALLVSVVSGAHAKTRIELWFDPVNQFAENLQPLVDRFNAEHPDIEAVMIAKAPNPDAILTAAAGGATPNVIFGAHSWSPTYAASGLLVDLWPYIQRDGLEAEYRSDFFPGALATGNTYRSQLIGLPLLLQIEAYYYNPDLFAQAGVAVPREGWTWDDMAALAQRMTRKDGAGNITVYGGGSTTAQNLLILFLIQNGAAIWDEERFESTVHTPQFREAAEYVFDLAQREVFYIGQNVHFGNEIRDAFLSGQVAIHQDGTYRLPAIEQSVPHIDVLPLPRKSPQDAPATMLTLRTLNIMRASDPVQEQASWTFVKWFMETENLAEASVAISALAGRRSVLDHPVYADYIGSSHHLTAFATLLAPYATGVGFTGIPGRDEIFSQGFTPLTVRMMRGELPVPAYIEQLGEVVNNILAPYR